LSGVAIVFHMPDPAASDIKRRKTGLVEASWDGVTVSRLFFGLRNDGEIVEITYQMTEPDYRRKGFAASLVQALADAYPGARDCCSFG